MSDTMQAPDQAPIGDGLDSTGGQDNRKKLMLLAGAAGLLVVLAAVYFLFLSGGSDEGEFGPLPQTSGAPTKPAEDPDNDPGTVEPPKFNAANAADPFRPLPAEAIVVVEPPAEDPEPPADPGTGGPGGTGGTQPTTAPTTAPTPAPTTKPTNQPTDPEPVTKYRVTVKSVSGAKDKAVIEVNGKRYEVKVKQTFPSAETGPFKLIRVGELPSGKPTATVVFGSDVPVELPKGEKKTFTV